MRGGGGGDAKTSAVSLSKELLKEERLLDTTAQMLSIFCQRSPLGLVTNFGLNRRRLDLEAGSTDRWFPRFVEN